VATWQAASLLLGYPDDELRERLPLLRSIAESVPGTAGSALAGVVRYLDSTPAAEAAAGYVETFDHRRRCCPYLTYHAYGDTRRRGMALLRFKHAYTAAGLRLSDDELPDHLAVVLEFAATGDGTEGMRLMLDHRAGIELLRLALEDARSPYAGVLHAVCATLPALPAQDLEAVLRLAAEGPPGEDVGLEPFAPPEYMPHTTRETTGGRR
jgi:nitrate reductase delta subunit